MEGFSPEQVASPETLEKEYIYIDHEKDNEVIFVCKAGSIGEADEKFRDELGQDPEMSHIGCVTEAPVNEAN